MKSLKKLFTTFLIVTSALMFFGCNLFPEEDEELTVDFVVTGTTSKTVKMTASSSKQNGNDVYIIYTIDGSEPKVTMELDVSQNELDRAAGNPDKIREYVNYGTAEFIESGKSITVAETTTIKAIAFYIISKDLKPLKTGPVTEQEITVAGSPSSNKPTDSKDNQTGTLTFKLASTGNTNRTHYFDTSNKTFKYTLNGNEYANCYYQFQFSYKGSGKGNWYLYVRQLGNGKPIANTEGTTNFLARGVYESSCFDATDGKVADGTLTLKTLKGNDFGKATVSNDSFSLKIDGDTASATYTSGNIATAINDAK